MAAILEFEAIKNQVNIPRKKSKDADEACDLVWKMVLAGSVTPEEYFYMLISIVDSIGIKDGVSAPIIETAPASLKLTPASALDGQRKLVACVADASHIRDPVPVMLSQFSNDRLFRRFAATLNTLYKNRTITLSQCGAILFYFPVEHFIEQNREFVAKIGRWRVYHMFMRNAEFSDADAEYAKALLTKAIKGTESIATKAASRGLPVLLYRAACQQLRAFDSAPPVLGLGDMATIPKPAAELLQRLGVAVLPVTIARDEIGDEIGDDDGYFVTLHFT
jgi:hypothetical protein